MAEQAAQTDESRKNWLDDAKNAIKEREKKIAITKMRALKSLIKKSCLDTLKELKLAGKYDDEFNKTSYFEIEEDELVNKLLTAWDTLKLNEWSGPKVADDDGDQKGEYSEYESEALKFADSERGDVVHVFWSEILVNGLFAFSAKFTKSVFPEMVDQNTQQTLQKCLNVCTILDLMKSTIVVDQKKQSLLEREAMTQNLAVTALLNEHIGTKLNVEKWHKEQEMDAKKVYAKCGQILTKTAMSSGKDFVKLYKIYKIRKHKEKKRMMEEQEKQKAKAKEEEEKELEERPSVEDMVTDTKGEEEEKDCRGKATDGRGGDEQRRERAERERGARTRDTVIFPCCSGAEEISR